METLDKKLQKQVRTASKKLGVPEREIIKRAVSSYLINFEDITSLRSELRVWDIISAKSMRSHHF